MSRNTLLSPAPAIVLLMLCACQFGCANEQALTVQQVEAAASQKYDYDYVKRQARTLEPGMSKAEVLVRLGSPAQQEPARWVYLPKRPGVLVPAEALVVRFVGGRYDNHRTVPIVLGERLGN